MGLETPPSEMFDIPLPTTSDLNDGGVLLPVDYVSQGSAQELCWAACCEMVARANGLTNLRMCDIVHKFLPSAACCQSDGSCASECDQNVADPVQAYDAIGVALCDPNSPYQYPFSFQGLYNEIVVNHRPVEIYFLWAGGQTAHLALAIGLSGNDMVYINDSIYGRGWTTYEDVLEAYGQNGQWRQTWQGIGGSLAPFS